MSGVIRSADSDTSESAHATIDWLPDELLLSIVRHSGLEPLRICAVCARWRRIGLSTKSLWTKIALEDCASENTAGKAEYIAARSGDLPLTIIRHGLDDDNEDDEDIDDLVLALFPRCRSFTYHYCPYKDTTRPPFLKALLRTRSAVLEHLFLESKYGLEVSFDSEVLPMIADYFPSLKSITLEHVCLRLSRMMTSSQCSTVRSYHRCLSDSHCRHIDAYGLEIDRLVSALPSLRVLRADYQRGQWIEPELVAFPDYFHLHDAVVTLCSTIENLMVLAVPTVWPSPRQLEIIALPRLGRLSLSHQHTSPKIYENTNNPSVFTHAASPLLQLLAAAPNLTYLNIQVWYEPPAAPVLSPSEEKRPVTTLPRLREVDFLEVHEVYVQQIFAAFRFPGLRSLTLSTLIRDRDVTEFSLDDAMDGWDFPYLRTFSLSSFKEADDYGNPSYPALALGRMLREGNLPRLRMLEVTTPGWITEPDLRDAVEAIRDPSVAPSLKFLEVSNSSPSVEARLVKVAVRERNTQLCSCRRLNFTLLPGYESQEDESDDDQSDEDDESVEGDEVEPGRASQEDESDDDQSDEDDESVEGDEVEPEHDPEHKDPEVDTA